MTDEEVEKSFNECEWGYALVLFSMTQKQMEALEFAVDAEDAKEWRCFAYWYDKLRELGRCNFDGVPFANHLPTAQLRWELRLRQLAERREEED
jgi:hypothetical protein